MRAEPPTSPQAPDTSSPAPGAARTSQPSPPTFDEAKSLRHRARAAGLDPHYWYPAFLSSEIKPGTTRGVRFWERPIAIWRTTSGTLHAIEDRCAHRQLRLSTGHVQGNRLVCEYHGWAHAGNGKVVDIPHNLFGKKQPKACVRPFPIQERYGIIWIWPGEASRVHERDIPHIPELEGSDPWGCVPISFTLAAHHSMVIDNVCDFTHAYLHRKYAPFTGDAELVDCDTADERVVLKYKTKVGGGKLSGMFVDRKSVDTSHIEVAYDYPYQRSNTDDKIKHWMCMLPESRTQTKAFFLFYFKNFQIPFTGVRLPQQLMTPFLKAANRLMVGPLLGQDAWALEEEQRAYDEFWYEPVPDLNPAVRAFQDLTVRKWQAYRDSPSAGILETRRSACT